MTRALAALMMVAFSVPSAAPATLQQARDEVAAGRNAPSATARHRRSEVPRIVLGGAALAGGVAVAATLETANTQTVNYPAAP